MPRPRCGHRADPPVEPPGATAGSRAPLARLVLYSRCSTASCPGTLASRASVRAVFVARHHRCSLGHSAALSYLSPFPAAGAALLGGVERGIEMEMEMDREAGGEGRPRQGAASSSATPFGRSSSRLGAAGGAESFDGALRELKDLRAQLHQAADCCEKAFLDTEKKKLILEGTKSYICDAIIAVIDHLGTVSSKLEHQLQEKSEITQTEQKINFLKQRLLACEQYAISLKLFAVRGDTDAVQYHRRYLSQSTERTNEENGANSSKADQELLDISPPVPGGTRTFKPYDVQSTMGIEPSMAAANFRSLAATRNSFSFRAEDVHVVLGDRKKKASHGSNILSFLRRSRRHA